MNDIVTSAIGASSIVVGVYYYTYAFRHAADLKYGEGLFFVALGVLGIFGGVGWMFVPLLSSDF